MKAQNQPAIAAALHLLCLGPQTAPSPQGARGAELPTWSTGMSYFSRDTLKRKIQVLRPLCLKSR